MIKNLDEFEIVLDTDIADSYQGLHIPEIEDQGFSKLLEQAGFSPGDEVTITIKSKQ